MSTQTSNRESWRAFDYRIYLIEGLLLGLFMMSACGFGTLLEYPGSPVNQAVPSPGVRRALMGIAMGLTALTLVYSPIGKRSGPHMNPAVTICFARLGRIRAADAFFFVIAQFIGSIVSVSVMEIILGHSLSQPPVDSVATKPGSSLLFAWIAELVMTFILMTVVLMLNRKPNIAPFTGLFTAILIAVYIFLAAPISGMSMNPARSFGSAIYAGTWSSLWIYFTAPPFGMLLAVECQKLITCDPKRLCGKLAHGSNCIFQCNCLRQD